MAAWVPEQLTMYTETTNALYQDHYANMYALGFRLVVS